MENDRKRLATRRPLTDTVVEIGGRLWTLTTVADLDALVDAVQTDADLEQFPYGLTLWASAIGLADRLAAEPALVRGRRVLELGAGVGLPGMVAQSLGGRVTQTDYQEDLLTLARINARQNNITGITHAIADWRRFPPLGAFDVVLGSDVLYERTLHVSLARVLAQTLAPNGLLLLSDPLRPQAFVFADHLEQSGWRLRLESRTVLWENAAREIALFFARPPGSPPALLP